MTKGSEPLVQLSKEFSVPARKYAIGKNAIIGIPNSGKTYTAMKIAEDLLQAGIPIVVFDVVGVWKYLKVGKRPFKGYKIVVAGGKGCDIELTENNAKDIIHAVLKSRVSIIIDFHSRELGQKSKWKRIVKDIVDVLMYDNEELRHVILEEAPEFIPQHIRPEIAQVYGVLESLARTGRNQMLGLTIISQRSEEVNKAVFELCHFVVLHKQTGKNSLLSIQKWIKVRDMEGEQDILNTLPKLAPGDCWAIGLTEKPHMIHVSGRKTFHPSPDAEMDEVTMDTKEKIVNVDDFVAKLKKELEAAKTINVKSIGKTTMDVTSLKPGESVSIFNHDTKKRANDIEKLTLENEELRKDNRELRKILEEDRKYWQAKRELSKKKLKAIEIANATMRTSTEELLEIFNSLDTTNHSKIPDQKFVGRGAPKSIMSRDIMNNDNIMKKHLGSIIPLPNDLRPVSSKDSGIMRMLRAIVMYTNSATGGVNRSRIGGIAGLSSTSGTFSTHLSTLKKQGYLEVVGPDVYRATEAGITAAGEVPPIPEGSELVDFWAGILGPESGPTRILRAIAGSNNLELQKYEIGDATGLSPTSGTFNTYLSTLRRYGLIESKGDIVKLGKDITG